MGLIVAASIATAFSIVYLQQIQPESDSRPGIRFDNETLFRSIAPFGHHLGILASYSVDEASIAVGNPSGYEFENCSVIMNTVVGEIANTTLKTYDRILAHSYDYFFTAKLNESNYKITPSWLILECKDPHELATTPTIFMGKLYYMDGENVTLKGMVGYSEITLRVLDADDNVHLERKSPTNDGFLEFTFMIPDDAKPGTWSYQVDTFSESFSQGFTVVGDS